MEQHAYQDNPPEIWLHGKRKQHTEAKGNQAGPKERCFPFAIGGRVSVFLVSLPLAHQVHEYKQCKSSQYEPAEPVHQGFKSSMLTRFHRCYLTTSHVNTLS